MSFWKLRWLDNPSFRLTVDGDVVGYFMTDREACEAVPDDYEACYYVHKRVGSRWFVGSFGYKPGAGMSTAALAAAGVPLAPQCVSDERI